MDNRVYKFRAWHKKDKKMLYKIYSLTCYPKQGEISGIMEVDYEDLDYLEDIELMQYIGLKDKAGKEIYEGDIVHCWSEYQTGEDKRLVEHGRWEVYWRIDRWHLRHGEALWDNGDYYYGDEVYWNDVEVVGNIYENSELLEKTKER